MDIKYIGENLLPGQIGQFLITLSLICSLFGLYSYLQVVKSENKDLAGLKNWTRIARISYTIHALAVIGIFGTLFYIIQNHLFEYKYAYSHSSVGLKAKYLLACFWEGSEGSFLLWTFWHAVLGFFIIGKAGKWESRVMPVVLLVQAILLTLQLGVYIGDIKIGSTAFTLLRNELEAPIFAKADYLKFVTDGNGLNVLLQNYWMVIHPPVLFLGFALSLFPFAYAIAALWKGEYKTWITPALRWSLATGAVLGTGIMMGGAWAYESLTFGGYWAWDPVENASLVPWLIMISGIHTLLVYKSTGRSLKITLLFFVIQYFLIWYSTFLTRTGVLGDTSVHAFTGEGASMKWHLVIAMAMLLVLGVVLLIKQWKKMPHIAGEEALNSREFWMLIGSIVILLASMHIIAMTSLPVWAPLYKSLTGNDVAPPNDVITYYNDRQVWFAITVAILTACTQFFKYKKTANMRGFWLNNGLLFVAAIAIGCLVSYKINVVHVQYIIFFIVAIYALMANLTYLFTVQKVKLRKAGGSITHIGFALILIGILFSAYKKQVISLDISGRVLNFGKETFQENANESRNNVMLYRNSSIPMGEYLVTYLGDSVDNHNDPPITYFKVRFEKVDPKTNKTIESFMLYPDAFVNPKGQQGLSSNPDARHFWNRDIFIYVNSFAPKETDTSIYRPMEVKMGDSIFVNNGYFVLESASGDITNKEYKKEPNDAAIGINFAGYDIGGKVGEIQPVFYVRGTNTGNVADSLNALGTHIRVEEVDPTTKTFKLGVKQRAQQDDYIVLKALVFPLVGLLWTGIIIMVLGFFVALFARLKTKEKLQKSVLDHLN